MKKAIYFIIALLIFFAGFYTGGDDPQEMLYTQAKLEEQEKEVLPDFVEVLEESELTAYYQLNEEEQAVYDILLKGIANQKESIVLDAGVDGDMVDRCLQSIDIDHPELFWLSTGYVTWEDQVSSEITSVEPEYYFTQDEAAEHQAQIEAAAAEIVQGISSDASDYEKVKYVYEELIWNTDYVDESEYNQSIYSVLLNHETVCTGYAKTLQYILRDLQIPCIYVYGTADDGESAGSHAWNIVEIDGGYYYVDPTWGDSENPEDDEYISYDYLCRSNEFMDSTHTLEMPVEMPQCLDDSLNYYKLNGMWYESYDETAIKAKIEADLAIGESIILVFERTEDYQAMFAAVEEGSVNDWICEVKGVDNSSIEYWYDDSSRYIELIWEE